MYITVRLQVLQTFCYAEMIVLMYILFSNSFWDFYGTKRNLIWEETYNKIVKQEEKKFS